MDGRPRSRRRGCPTGMPVASRDAPVGRPGGARGRDDARRLDLGGGRAQARRRDRGQLGAARLLGEAPPGPPLAGDPGRRRAGRVAEDRLSRAGDLGQRPDRARGRRGGASRSAASPGALTIALSLVLAIGLFFVDPGRRHQPDQGPARLLGAVLARRGGAADRDLHRLPGRDQPPSRPAAGVRVPRRRAQDDLLLRGRRPAGARARRALLAPSPALRHQLPARRHDRRDLRLRAARPARLVLAARLADPRHPADRRASPTR